MRKTYHSKFSDRIFIVKVFKLGKRYHSEFSESNHSTQFSQTEKMFQKMILILTLFTAFTIILYIGFC
jgi:hypothetical protein